LRKLWKRVCKNYSRRSSESLSGMQSMEKGKQRPIDLKIYDQIKRLLHIILHHNIEKNHHFDLIHNSIQNYEKEHGFHAYNFILFHKT